MFNEKKVIIPIGIILVVSIIVGGILLFNLSNDIEVGFGTPANADEGYFVGMPVFAFNNFISSTKKERIRIVSDEITEYSIDFTSNYEKPYYIDATYENIDGKTVITYRGQITDPETKNLVDYEKVFTYDFYITDKIN